MTMKKTKKPREAWIYAHEKDQPSLFENHEMGYKTPDGTFYLTLEEIALMLSELTLKEKALFMGLLYA